MTVGGRQNSSVSEVTTRVWFTAQVVNSPTVTTPPALATHPASYSVDTENLSPTNKVIAI